MRTIPKEWETDGKIHVLMIRSGRFVSFDIEDDRPPAVVGAFARLHAAVYQLWDGLNLPFIPFKKRYE